MFREHWKTVYFSSIDKPLSYDFSQTVLQTAMIRIMRYSSWGTTFDELGRAHSQKTRGTVGTFVYLINFFFETSLRISTDNLPLVEKW